MTTGGERTLLRALSGALALPVDGERVEVRGPATLASAYPVSGLAAASIATAGRAVAALLDALGFGRPGVAVDRPLADAWFAGAVRPVGWKAPPAWDPIAGDYPSADGWIRLHTNAPHHRAAALRVLGAEAARPPVAAAVTRWDGEALQEAVVSAGGCAAVLHTPEQWRAHPQGAAVWSTPLVVHAETSVGPAGVTWPARSEAPLAGLRVLDLTRIIAGPVATRLLAGLGADVLRIDPPGWEEPAAEPELTFGKRTARLDLRRSTDRAALGALLAAADVVVSGYRADALERLGLGPAARAALRPGLVDVSLTAYGPTGPWAMRRGFDSLVQMSSGIAAAGLVAGTADHPTPLPVQALDHATGYLMAAAVLVGLAERVRSGSGRRSELSLAGTAAVLERARATGPNDWGRPDDAGSPGALPRVRIDTAWGAAERLAPPVQVGDVRFAWPIPPRPLGSDRPQW